jgi:hypothetical protein
MVAATSEVLEDGTYKLLPDLCCCGGVTNKDIKSGVVVSKVCLC